MTKLKMIRLYKTDDVPDHIVEEVNQYVDKMAEAFGSIPNPQNPNIVLSALARFHAAMICVLVSETGLEEAAKTEAIGLLKNVEHISGQKFKFLANE